MQTFERPIERAKTVTLGLGTDQSGPNVVAGIFITATLQAATGRAPWWWPAVAGFAWGTSVVIYSLADEIREQIEEEKNRLLDPIDDRPRGVE